jgi:hypothetical protein
MDLLANLLLAAGAFASAAYCWVLSQRIKRFTALESGMGTAIAVLSAQVDEMTQALESARRTAGGSAAALEGQTARAEAAAARLELLVASLHDLPEAEGAAAPMEGRLRVVRRRAGRGPEAAE